MTYYKKREDGAKDEISQAIKGVTAAEQTREKK